MNILVTGGAGFIGSNYLNKYVKKYPQNNYVNVDKLSYAADLFHLNPILKSKNFKNYKVDITKRDDLKALFENHKFETVIHFAAESHVDRSINNPYAFCETNITGTLNILDLYNRYRPNGSEGKFVHVSTDEVYGSLGDEGAFSEESQYKPNSPYSASKAASDHFVRAFNKTFNLPTIITHCSNNYGPNQHKEKFIPTIIDGLINNTTIPIYGNGSNIRDWIYVEDHIDAIDLISNSGRPGETYNIGGGVELTNNNLVELIIRIYDEYTNRANLDSRGLIKNVVDRKGHDFRYAIDFKKLSNELNWKPKYDINKALEITIKHYVEKAAK